MADIFEHMLEATPKQLQRKQKSITRLFPEFPDRVKAVAANGGVRLKGVENVLWHFQIHSGTKKDVWYDVYLRFKNIVPTLQRIVKDRRLWVGDKSRIDRRKLARKFMDVVDIQIKCSCPAFQYWGPAYILSLGKYDAKHTDREIRPPRVRNPKQYGAYCKHLANLMKVLPFYADTAMQWIEDFYDEEVKQAEQDTKKEYGWIKKAAKSLAKKKEEEEEKPEEEKPEEEDQESEEKSEEEQKESRIRERRREAVFEIADSAWKRIGQKINQMFEEGYATCPYATKELGRTFSQEGVEFKVVDGKYKGVDHYWIEAGGHIFDLGNNVDEKAIETGRIVPKVIPMERSKEYLPAEYMEYAEFLRYYQTLPSALVGEKEAEESKIREKSELGSCMIWAEGKVEELLSQGVRDFKVIEGYVYFAGNDPEENRTEHTWIELSNGKILDGTIDQFEHWGFDKEEVFYQREDRKEYSPLEYLDLCKKFPA